MKQSKDRVIKICPICGSQKIYPYMGFATGIKYKCENCGYVGVLVLEETGNFSSFIKRLKSGKNSRKT
jgi:transposase-like protein